jgi:hypothetical protein
LLEHWLFTQPKYAAIGRVNDAQKDHVPLIALELCRISTQDIVLQLEFFLRQVLPQEQVYLVSLFVSDQGNHAEGLVGILRLFSRRDDQRCNFLSFFAIFFALR